MQNWSSLLEFPPEKIEIMRGVIAEKRSVRELEGFFVNQILREDIFNILDACCTVIYCPLPDEDNDGFHVSYPVDYAGCDSSEGRAHFVFLNTAKPLEKQVFAAGHELGHIWNVADSVWDKTFSEITPRTKENEEAAMNRFSAELLMPEKQFMESAAGQLKNYRENGKLKVVDAFRMISSLMNEFCVPAQAVILRLYETKCLSPEVCEQLLHTGPRTVKDLTPEAYQDLFVKMLNLCIQEGGYTRLRRPTMKRGIKGFPKILDEAAKKGVIPFDKIRQLRELLEIPDIQEDDASMELEPEI